MLIKLTQEDMIILNSFGTIKDVLDIKPKICQSSSGGIPGGGPEF